MSALDPVPYKMRRTRKRLCTYDVETDPFKAGRVPVPFAVGFYDGEEYHEWWGSDCIEQSMEYIASRQDDLLVYVHNGGNFDFAFLLPHADFAIQPLVINKRLVTAWFAGQEFRDSLRIIPVALSQYRKDEIDYKKLERRVRERHKAEILSYLRTDCEALHELVTSYHERFGDKVTIASTALPLLHAHHGYERLSEGMDAQLRRFYTGGRVQCFATGVFHGSFIIVDRNSMYPAVMLEYPHPIGNSWRVNDRITDSTWFVRWRGKSNGCAYTARGFGLSFEHGTDDYLSTIHELKAGIATGTIEIDYIYETWDCDLWTKFDAFVRTYYELRKEAKRNGDKAGDIFYKLILNSAYGKLGMDPRLHETFRITGWGYIPPGGTTHQGRENGWSLDVIFGGKKPQYCIWKKPSHTRWNNFHNVATAASITGGARANLLLNIHRADNPLYCDTDSLICEGFSGPLGDDLGQWKIEAKGCLVAISGRKTYVVYAEEPPAEPPKWFKEDPKGHTYKDPVTRKTLYCIKKASKGFNLTGNDLIAVAQGREMKWSNPVPTFKLDGSVEWVERTMRRTGDVANTG